MMCCCLCPWVSVFQQLPRCLAEHASLVEGPKPALTETPVGDCPTIGWGRVLQGVCLLSSMQATLDSAGQSRSREPGGGPLVSCRGHIGGNLSWPPTGTMWGSLLGQLQNKTGEVCGKRQMKGVQGASGKLNCSRANVK